MKVQDGSSLVLSEKLYAELEKYIRSRYTETHDKSS